MKKIKRLCLEAKKSLAYKQYLRSVSYLHPLFALELMLAGAAAGLTKLEIFYEAFFALFHFFDEVGERKELSSKN